MNQKRDLETAAKDGAKMRGKKKLYLLVIKLLAMVYWETEKQMESKAEEEKCLINLFMIQCITISTENVINQVFIFVIYVPTKKLFFFLIKIYFKNSLYKSRCVLGCVCKDNLLIKII
jgi:hypothetical protein